MHNLVTKVLYQKRRFILGWSIGLFALSVFMMLLFPALQRSEIGQFFSGLSPALQKVAGGQDSFSTAAKYINGELFALRMPLLFIVLSIILFTGLTVGDERRGVVMTQLSLPFSRSGLLVRKLAAALIVLLIVSLSMTLGIMVGLLLIHEPIDVFYIVRHSSGCLLIALDFGLLVFVLGGGLGNKGAAIGVASGTAFVSYLISSLTPVVSSLKPFEEFSLFHYYQNPSPVSHGHAVLLLAVAVVEIAIGLVAFSRRDVE